MIRILMMSAKLATAGLLSILKGAQEPRDNQFLFQNVQTNEIFEIFKMFKNIRWINVYYTKSKRL